MKTRFGIICIILLMSMSVAGCKSGNANIAISDLTESELPPFSSETDTSRNPEVRYYGGANPEDQEVSISPQYYGTWIVGDMIGDGYGHPGIDPHGQVMGGKLIIEKDKVTFDGPKGELSLENPRYATVLETAYSFSTDIISNYDSFGFPNDFLIRIEIYAEDKRWEPLGLGPFWIKDRDTLVASHSVYHELKREDTE